MADAVGAIRLQLGVNHAKFGSDMRRAKGSVTSFRSSVLGLSRSMVGMFGIGLGGAGVAMALKSLAHNAEEFNKAMNRSLAIMTDVSAKMRTKMEEAARSMAAVTVFSSKEMAESYYFLASSGKDAVESLKALPVAATFAQAGMFDMARATELLVGAQSALGLKVKDTHQNYLNMIHVGDLLVKANMLAQASVEQFSEALTNKAAAAMRSSEMSFEEGIAILAAYAEQEMKGAEAGTAFTIVLREFQRCARDNAAAFEKFGIKLYDTETGATSLAMGIRSVEEAVAGMSPELKDAALAEMGFQLESIAFLKVLQGSSDVIDSFEKSLSDVGGVMQGVADKQMTDLEKKTAALGAVWDDMAAKIVPPVFDALILTLENLSDSLDDVGRCWAAFMLLFETGIPISAKEQQDYFLTLGEAWKLFDKPPKATLPNVGADQVFGKSAEEAKRQVAIDLALGMSPAGELFKKAGETFEEAVKTFGMTARQKKIWAVEQEQGSPEMLAALRALDATLTKKEAEAQQKIDREKLIQSLRTPGEVFRDQMIEASKLLSGEMLSRAGDKYSKEFLGDKVATATTPASAQTLGTAGAVNLMAQRQVSSIQLQEQRTTNATLQKIRTELAKIEANTRAETGSAVKDIL